MKGKLFITFYIFLAILIIIPYVLWQISTEKKLQVLIIDKTVQNENYLNHKGVVWALNFNKYIKENEEYYDVRKDFTGLTQNEISENSIKSTKESSISNYNLIYIADTYGVNGVENKGISSEEIATIKNSAYKNQTTIIAEFNSFNNYTEIKARQELTKLLRIEWTGWIGRYFTELNPEKNNEIDLNFVSNYEKQNRREWDFQDGGLILIREDNYIIVLNENDDFKGKGVQFNFTNIGEDFWGQSITARYTNWFDIVKAKDTDTMASYNLNLTDEGKEKLKDYNIPDIFPAVTKTKTLGMPIYYFAGDFASTQYLPSFYKYKGLDKILSGLRSFQKNDSDDFYYHVFLPMMGKILDESFNIKQNMNTKTKEEYEGDGIVYNSRINQDVLEIYSHGVWEKMIIKGVNLGIAKPGFWPGEAGISFDEYYRWMEQIAAMGSNTIRIYTIHPPEFYQALWLYNQYSKTPLYVMHGIWINEESLEETQDAFQPENIVPFEAEMKNVVDVINGNAILEDKIGHASGEYSYDVSEYISAWILGIEWSPYMVKNTNKVNRNLEEFQGNYFYTANAEAFEKWLAARMDYIIQYDSTTYGKQRLISFVNWPPTDLLEHPAEPFEEEDLVAVNPNNIYTKSNLKTGYFSSYHVYPYYPEFINYENEYLNFVDHRGENNNYAGYLKDLIEAHKIPILIAEFGVPASRGKTHDNAFGWNQGNLSEEEQGEIGVRLYEDIIAQGALGGIVFTWQDEWFKRTWNTMQLDNPDRRPYWSNIQTNEQRFGLLSFDILKKPLDGNREKWENENLLYENTNGELKTLFMDHDETYLYFMFEYKLKPDDIEKKDFYVFVNTIPDQGNEKISFIEDLNFEEGIDFIIEINNEEENSRILVDEYYDTFYYQYNYELKTLPRNEKLERNTGLFSTINLALSGSMYIPSTDVEVPFGYYETGKLVKALVNNETKEVSSLADYYVNQEEGIIEIRIPWLLLNFKDPSQKEIMGNLWDNGLLASSYIHNIEVSVGIGNNGKLSGTIPNRENSTTKQEMAKYKWKNWDIPNYKERLKPSYYLFQEAFLKNETQIELE